MTIEEVKFTLKTRVLELRKRDRLFSAQAKETKDERLYQSLLVRSAIVKGVIRELCELHKMIRDINQSDECENRAWRYACFEAPNSLN
jgi:hypothetical protein